MDTETVEIAELAPPITPKRESGAAKKRRLLQRSDVVPSTVPVQRGRPRPGKAEKRPQ